jgi:hypothetical protein
MTPRAIAAFEQIPVSSQVALLGLLAIYAGVPDLSLMTPAQQRAHRETSKELRRARQKWDRLVRRRERIERQIAGLSALLDLRRAAGKRAEYMPVEKQRREALYAQLNAVDEQMRAH